MSTETEIEIYAKIGDFSGLESAKERIFQEQVTIRTDKGKIRARMFKKEKRQRWNFEVTTKQVVAQPGQGPSGAKINIEINTPVREQVYQQFRSVSSEFERKIRYIFPVEKAFIEAGKLKAELEVEGLVYEVDVFIDKDGNFCEWCKIDIEIDRLKEQLEAAGVAISEFDVTARVSKLPLGLTSVFVNDGSDPKMGELVGKIFKNFFRRPVEENYAPFTQAEEGPEAPTDASQAEVHAKVA